jgi:hypothetical protein
MATINSAGAECLSTKPDAPASSARHVVQRLLCHAEQAERLVLPDDGRQRIEVRRQVEPALANPPFAFRPERLGQAELPQDRGVQLVRQRVDVLAEANERRAYRLHRSGLRAVRHGKLRATDVDRQQGEPLRHVVVQLTREQRAFVLMGTDQAPAEVAHFVVGAPSLRHVAEDAEGDGRASGGVAPVDHTDVMNPLFPVNRMQETILHGELVHFAGVQLLALVQYRGAVVRMQMLHPEFQDLEALSPVRWDTAQLAHPVVDVDGAGAEVDFVEGQAGELGARCQASLALLQTLLVAPAGERIGKHLRDQLQPLHQRVPPVALRTQSIEAQGADGRLAP